MRESKPTRVRPYYLYSIFRQLSDMSKPVEDNSLHPVAERLVEEDFRTDLQLYPFYCDICKGCPKMRESSVGSLWGERHDCESTDTAKQLDYVENQMRSILYDIGLSFYDVVDARSLLTLAHERRPYHYFHIPEAQVAYEKGVKYFAEETGVTFEISPELERRRKYYFIDEQG